MTGTAPGPWSGNVRYWLQGEATQNFGDFLTEYLLRGLFLPRRVPSSGIHLIGSMVADFAFHNAAAGPHAGEGPAVFWGCGLRHPDGLKPEDMAQARILAVRGPLSRRVLGLRNTVPIGDPALLLPLLYQPDPALHEGGTLLVPHFHDSRDDATLLALSGCDQVLRPNLPNSVEAIEPFLDALLGADFVLCGALHAAIGRAAFGCPYGFWDSGRIDLPFKWSDFAASVGTSCRFFATVSPARAHWETETAPHLRLPPLRPLLAAAPFPVRPEIMAAATDPAPPAFTLPTGLAALLPALAAPPGLSLPGPGYAQVPLLHWIVAAAAPGIVAAPGAADTVVPAALRDALARHCPEASVLGPWLRPEGMTPGSVDLLHLDARPPHRVAELLAWWTPRLSTRAVILLQGAAAGNTPWDEVAAEVPRCTFPDCDGLVVLAWGLEAPAQILDLCAAMADDAAPAQALFAHFGARWTEAHAHATRPAPAPVVEPVAAVVAGDTQARTELAEARAALAALQGEMQRLQASISWRLTQPLRTGVRRAPGVIRLAQAAGRTVTATVRLELAARLRLRRQRQQDRDTVAASPLFDRDWYVARNPDAANDPAGHYVWIGAQRGADPHPLFSTAHYAAHTPGLGGDNPLAHYLRRQGGATDPHPLFDTAHFLHQAGPDSAVPPLVRHLAGGTHDPNPWFDAAVYLHDNAEARQHPVPLLHWVLRGAAALRDPHPLFAAAWYAGQHPEAAADPLLHYLTQGQARGFPPSPGQAATPGPPPLRFVSQASPVVSVIVPTQGQGGELVRFLHALAARSGDAVPYEVIVAANDPEASMPLPAEAGLVVLHTDQASRQARGRYIVLLERDVRVHPGWLAPLVTLAAGDERIGMVGGKLLNVDGMLEEAGCIVTDAGQAIAYGCGDEPSSPQYNFVREVDAATTGALLIRADLFARLGSFSNHDAPARCAALDLAFTLRTHGFRVMYQPDSVVTRPGAPDQSCLDHAAFRAKWAARLREQPTREAPALRLRERLPPAGTVLLLEERVPEWDMYAGSVFTIQHISLLQSLGYKVVLAPRDGEHPQPYTHDLQQRGVEVLHLPIRLEDWLAENGQLLTLVWAARPQVAAPRLTLLRACTSAPLLYYTHDLHFLREQRRGETLGDPASIEESRRLRRVEQDIFAAVDTVLTPSTDEVSVIRAMAPDVPVLALPPYAMAAPSPDAGRDAIIFVGGFGHLPNGDAAAWLVRDIMPLVWRDIPEARLLIVGSNPDAAVRALAGERVEVTGQVPDLAPWYARARLSLSPLRYGAGIKGKVIGSLAAGVPVVTTPIGNEGIGLEHGTDALIGDTAALLAAHAIRLWRDPALARSLAEAGQAVLARRFGEDAVRATLAEAIAVARRHFTERGPLPQAPWATAPSR